MKKLLTAAAIVMLLAAMNVPADAGWRGRRDTAIGVGIGLGVLGALIAPPVYYAPPPVYYAPPPVYYGPNPYAPLRGYQYPYPRY